MIGVLHPCPGCGHRSMDDCWKAGREMTSRSRRMCVECHDDCLPRRASRKKPEPTPANPINPKEVHRILFATR